MKMNNTKLIQTIIIAGVLLGLGFMAKQTLDIYLEKKLLNEAVGQCAQISTGSWKTRDGSEVKEPYWPAYEKCMKEKGY